MMNTELHLWWSGLLRKTYPKGDEVFLKETAEFTKEFIKELKYACLWYLSNRGYKDVGRHSKNTMHME